MKKAGFLGILFLVAAVAATAAAAPLEAFLLSGGLGNNQLGFLEGIVGTPPLILLLFLMPSDGDPPAPTDKRAKALIVVILGASIFFAWAYKQLLFQALRAGMSSGLLAAVLTAGSLVFSMLDAGRRRDRWGLAAPTLCLVGVILAVGGGAEAAGWALIAAVAAAAVGAARKLLRRRLQITGKFPLITLYIATLVLQGVAMIGDTTTNDIDWRLIVLVAVLRTTLPKLLQYSSRRSTNYVAMLVTAAGVPLATIFGFLEIGQMPDTVAIIANLIIVTGVATGAYWESRRIRDSKL